MKIAIDASGAMGNQTGVGNYIFRLIENLNRLDNNEYLIYLNYFRRNKKNPFNNDYPIIKNRIPAKVQRFLQNKFRIPIEILIGDVDIFHGPNYFVPPSKKARTIVTVHDLTFEFFPETMIGNDATFYKKYVPRSIETSNHVITISQASKKDLIKKLNVPENKISVTYMAAGPSFKAISEPDLFAAVLKKYKLPSNFLLTVCTLEPRKNLITLAKALSVLKKNIQLKQKLVVVGSGGWKNAELFSLINKLSLEDDIIFPGYISQEDLPALYNACSVFLFPSLYEGFGIPPLEALSCGCPSICSNTSSIPEVVGDAAILIDPLNTELWAEKIKEVLSDKDLQEKLSKNGMVQAKKFSWEETARQTLEIYRKVTES